jgi:hypothetical protein
VGPRSGARIAAAARAASAAGSVIGCLRLVVGVAGDVVADRLRHGLAGDLPPGLFQGWHAELADKPGQESALLSSAEFVSGYALA